MAPMNKLARLTPAPPPPCRLHALPAPAWRDRTVVDEITTPGYTMCAARWSRQWAGARYATVSHLAAGRAERALLGRLIVTAMEGDPCSVPPASRLAG